MFALFHRSCCEYPSSTFCKSTTFSCTGTIHVCCESLLMYYAIHIMSSIFACGLRLCRKTIGPHFYSLVSLSFSTNDVCKMQFLFPGNVLKVYQLYFHIYLILTFTGPWFLSICHCWNADLCCYHYSLVS